MPLPWTRDKRSRKILSASSRHLLTSVFHRNQHIHEVRRRGEILKFVPVGLGGTCKEAWHERLAPCVEVLQAIPLRSEPLAVTPTHDGMGNLLTLTVGRPCLPHLSVGQGDQKQIRSSLAASEGQNQKIQAASHQDQEKGAHSLRIPAATHRVNGGIQFPIRRRITPTINPTRLLQFIIPHPRSLAPTSGWVDRIR